MVQDGHYRVSIGLPVYNGEEYVGQAIDSLLSQTYTDFALIICDNASTDGSWEICHAYAARDSRVRCFRNESNIGGAANFNRVFELSSSEYFKWAGHDDLHAPQHLERCVEALDRDPEVVLCHTLTRIIDSRGEAIRDYDDHLDLRAPTPSERFRDYLFRPCGLCNAIHGVIRASVLRRTALIGAFVWSDRILLGELALLGKFHCVPEVLFFRRVHPSMSCLASPGLRALATWFDPRASHAFHLNTTLPKDGVEFSRAIRRARLGSSETMRCHAHLISWLCQRPLWSLQRRWRGEARYEQQRLTRGRNA
jgi:glycosyltransferase involved in cell wall biosynthesis